ncbi:MAG: ABC transporter permease subunit [Pseudomonadota bacterium]
MTLQASVSTPNDAPVEAPPDRPAAARPTAPHGTAAATPPPDPVATPAPAVAGSDAAGAPAGLAATLAARLGGSIRGSIRGGASQTLGLSALSIALGLAFWWWACAVNLDLYVDFQNVPGPGTVFMAFLGHLATEEFYVHIAVSMQRIAISYALAVVIGIGIGLGMGRSRAIRAMVMPYIEIVRPIPAVAWIPLAILMWPTEEASIIYITFLGALFPIVLNTLHGVEQTPEVLVRAARSLGASRFAIFRHVVLPSALPSISAGLAIGMGVSWFSLLAGEIISGQYGIGYFTWNAYSLIEYEDIVVGMLVIGGLGTLSTWAVKRATAPLLAWQKRTR